MDGSGYGLCVTSGQFWCKFELCSAQNYGYEGVWVTRGMGKEGSTVLDFLITHYIELTCPDLLLGTNIITALLKGKNPLPCINPWISSTQVWAVAAWLLFM